MTGRRVQPALLGLVLAIVGVGPALAQDEPRVSFSTSVDYSVGDYGNLGRASAIFEELAREFERMGMRVH